VELISKESQPKRGRAATPASAKKDMADELDIPVQSLAKTLEEPGIEDDEEIVDTWNTPEEEEEEQGPTSKDIDTSITKDIPTDVNQANTYKNIIVKKVSKIEALPPQERAGSIDMSALKQFIQKPEVNKTLGVQTIRDLVSSIIG
jgi:spore cortex formation protein SpoVR/YcgB (stage V sporulation)